jgi:hypothetical protein
MAAKRKAAETAPWWQSKVTLWILGLLLATLSTAGGLLFNRVRSLQEERSELLSERDSAMAEARSTTAKVLELENHRRSAESRYKNLLLARNPLTGEPLFDRNGNPLYDTYEGSANEMEELHKSVERLQTEVITLQAVVREKDLQVATLRLQTSSPGRSRWDFSVGWQASWLTPASGAGTVGLGHHLDLLGLDVAPRLSMGYDLAAVALGRPELAWRGGLELVIRP